MCKRQDSTCRRSSWAASIPEVTDGIEK
jgi:hypothetical protein